MKTSFLFFLAFIILAPTTEAQTFITSENDEWCEQKDNYNSGKKRHCEVWETTLSTDQDILKVDSGQNGGIKIEAWNQDEILVRAKVQTWAKSKREAQALVDEVDIRTKGKISAYTPKSNKYENASVSFHIFVPKNSDLDLDTFNGGISISGVSGDISFSAMNGGVRLISLAGNVRGHTTNGGIKVELSGTEWEGEELDVETTNGGVAFYVPEDYNALLETGTINGSLKLDFPVTVSGRINRSVSVKIGDGGNKVSAKTTNGGVRVSHSKMKLSKL